MPSKRKLPPGWVVESNWRANAEEERRKVYLAIEGIVAARPRQLKHKGARVMEMEEYTGLPHLAVAAAMKFLRYFSVIRQVGTREWEVADLPQGFCWKHGVKHLVMGKCRRCEEAFYEEIESEGW